ncbi:MAG: hypothetical protein ACK4SY_07635 [Pyrobaculum sp.]
MGWLEDVIKAREMIERGRFSVVTHGGIAHMDDLLASALLYGRASVYRLNTYEQVVNIAGDVLLVDFGDGFRDKLPAERFVVLDHHGSSDEPSSIVQVATALGVTPSPAVATLTHFVDLFDRFGPSVKKVAGHYGNSLNHGLTRIFSSFAGAVRDRFMELVTEAYLSKTDVSLDALFNALKIAERLQFTKLAEHFPRTFAQLRLMLQAAGNPSVALSKEAVDTGFGVDFGCYAVLAVPELERYVLQGLEQYFEEAKRAAETVLYMRYSMVKKAGRDVVAIVVDEPMSPTMLWNALKDLGMAEGPTFIVMKDVRTPGGYTVWRPQEYAEVIDFRKLSGENVVFKHAGGFLAVVKAKDGQDAAISVLKQLLE